MKYTLRSIFAFLITFTIIAPLSVIVNYGISLDRIFLILLFVHIVINLLLFNTKILKWFLIVFFSITAIVLSLLLLIDGKIQIPFIVERYFIDLYNAVVYSKYVTSYMFIPTLYLISVGISLPVYMLIQKLKKYMILFAIVFSFFASLIIGGFQIKFIYFFIFLFTYTMMYFEQYFSYRDKDKKTNKSVLSLLPALLIFAFILTLLPSWISTLKTDPVSFVDSLVDKVRSINFGTRSLGEEAVVAYQTDTAYSEGSSSFDSTVVMIVDSPKNFHLRSQTYDYYDGTNWSISEDMILNNTNVSSGESFATFELIENVLGYYAMKNNILPDVQDLTEQEFFMIADDLFETIDLTITYNNIRTKAVFTPSNTISLEHDGSNRISLDVLSGVFSSEDTLRKDFMYTIKTMIPKTQSREFEELLRNADNEINLLISNPNMDAYLQIPDLLPQRVKDLAVSITEAYDNDYDKARAIERYLSSNYPYSLEVENTPDGFDFVDYFLFEGKTGYCTYYASSMTIMLRTLGIPTRYARGYVMPKKPPITDTIDDFGGLLGLEELQNQTIYTIYERYSHAWSEVYISGYGWLEFEPTSAYYNSFLPDHIQEDPYEQKDPIDGNTDPVDLPDYNRIELEKYLIVLLVVLLAILICMPFVYRLYKTIRYSRFDARRKVLHTFIKITDLLRLINVDILPYETARTYAKKIDQKLHLGEYKFEKIVWIFEKARYSQDEVNDDDLNRIKKYHSLVKEEVLSYANKFKIIAYFFSNKV